LRAHAREVSLAASRKPMESGPEQLHDRERHSAGAPGRGRVENGGGKPGTLDPTALVRMQRSVGNAAVRLMVQRSVAAAPSRARKPPPLPLAQVALGAAREAPVEEAPPRALGGEKRWAPPPAEPPKNAQRAPVAVATKARATGRKAMAAVGAKLGRVAGGRGGAASPSFDSVMRAVAGPAEAAATVQRAPDGPDLADGASTGDGGGGWGTGAGGGGGRGGGGGGGGPAQRAPLQRSPEGSEPAAAIAPAPVPRQLVHREPATVEAPAEAVATSDRPTSLVQRTPGKPGGGVTAVPAAPATPKTTQPQESDEGEEPGPTDEHVEFGAGLVKAVEVHDKIAQLRKIGMSTSSREIQGLLETVDKQWIDARTGMIRSDIGKHLVDDWLPARGRQMTEEMLDESERVTRWEGKRYAAAPGAGTARQLREAASDLHAEEEHVHAVQKQIEAKKEKEHQAQEGEEPGTGAGSYSHEVDESPIAEAQARMDAIRRAYGAQFPVLMAGVDFGKLAKADDKTLQSIVGGAVGETLSNINDTRKYLKDGMLNIWDLDPVMNQVMLAHGIKSGSAAFDLIEAERKRRAHKSMIESIASTVLMIGLGVVAVFATGGLALGAFAITASVSTMNAIDTAADYTVKKAARGTALDVANAISQEDPSKFWLAFAVAGAILDVGAAAKAFHNMAKVAYELEKLEQLAKAEANALKSTGKIADEEAFVAKIMKAARAAKGPAVIGRAQILGELLQANSPRMVNVLAGEEQAAAKLLRQFGNWKEVIGVLEQGKPEMKAIGSKLQEFREALVKRLGAAEEAKGGFGAKRLGSASTEAISDVDLQVASGAQLIKAEEYMAKTFGKNWEKALRMNFYTDASRLSKYADVMKLLSRPARSALQQRITALAEKFNLAKMLRHARGSKESTARVEALLKSLVSDKKELDAIRKLAETSEAAGLATRNARLREVDELMAKFEKAGDAERIKLAEEITGKQMEANFFTKEAYISPGAGRAAAQGVALIGPETYQRALSELEMLEHIVHESGGDVLKAMREYEFFKYVNRWGTAAINAGYQSKTSLYLEELGEYIYRVFREGHSDVVPGGLPKGWDTTKLADRFGVPMPHKVNDEFLLKQYQAFKAEAEAAMPKIKNAAMRDPAEWRPAEDLGTPRAGGGGGTSGGGRTVSGGGGTSTRTTSGEIGGGTHSVGGVIQVGKPNPIGFAQDAAVSALAPERLQHASEHLRKAGLLPNWSKATGVKFKTLATQILEHPQATFDHVLKGPSPAKGFLGEIAGHRVVIFVYKDGPDAGKIATAIVPSSKQLEGWGLK
jgi:hypothetical protein